MKEARRLSPSTRASGLPEPSLADSERVGGEEQRDRIISAAVALFGDSAQATRWFHNEPIADYGHRTAAELVRGGHYQAVLSYLRDLENGACG